MQVSDLAPFVCSIEAPQVGPMLAALAARLDNLVTIGLGYLSLDRESATLSGGESQRVKMVRHLGSSLTDITYVFDEPSVGLHPHDVGRLAGLMQKLRDKGNTVLIVEHKPDMIAIADHVVDMGPLAGSKGGEIVYEGCYEGLLTSGTLTGNHIRKYQPIKTEVREPDGELRAGLVGGRLEVLEAGHALDPVHDVAGDAVELGQVIALDVERDGGARHRGAEAPDLGRQRRASPKHPRKKVLSGSCVFSWTNVEFGRPCENQASPAASHLRLPEREEEPCAYPPVHLSWHRSVSSPSSLWWRQGWRQHAPQPNPPRRTAGTSPTAPTSPTG
jgi:hypothetical protein